MEKKKAMAAIADTYAVVILGMGSSNQKTH